MNKAAFNVLKELTDLLKQLIAEQKRTNELLAVKQDAPAGLSKIAAQYDAVMNDEPVAVEMPNGDKFVVIPPKPAAKPKPAARRSTKKTSA
jgi:hypothetical protein